MSGVQPILREISQVAVIPAPTGDEGDRIEWLEARLAGAAGSRRRDAVGNLLWTFGPGRPRLLLLAHVDTVFPPDVRIEIVERAGWLHGPGCGDNAAAVVVTMLAAERHPVDGLAVAFTVGEEGLGNLRGARAACEALQPEMVIALEGHGLDEVMVDAVGSVRASLIVTGPGGHSWWDRGRPSAVHGLVGLIDTLLDEAGADLVVNVGRVAGGGAVNAIADRAEALIEGRSLVEASLERFATRLGESRVPAPLAIAIEMVGRRGAGRLDRGHPLLAAVRAVRARLDLPDRLGDGSTDANAALAAGVPALCLGCARGRDMHSVAEAIDCASVEVGLAQLEGVIVELLA